MPVEVVGDATGRLQADSQDLPPRSALEDLEALAVQICGAPIALFTMAGARVGQPRETVAAGREISGEEPFDAQHLAQPGWLIVLDAASDRRFASTALLAGSQPIRFYAGLPLRSPGGQLLATLRVLDPAPHTVAPADEMLRALGRQAATFLSLWSEARSLAASEARLRLATDNARVGLVVVDRGRRYLHANHTYAEVLGLPSADIVGQRVQDVLPDLYEPQISPRLDRAFAGETVSYELRRHAADGERHYAVKYEPTRVDGAVALVAVVITDITERKQAEAASGRLAAIVESSADAIIGKDLNGIVTSWNGGAEALFGYTAAEMVGTPVLRLIPVERRTEEDRILARIREGFSTAMETVRLTKDGRAIDVSVTASPIRDASGKVVGASKLARDISERVRAEREIRFQRAMLHTERELTLDGILAVDAGGRVLSFNGRFARMWGFPPELLAKHDDAPLLQAVLDKFVDPEQFLRRVRELYDQHDQVSQDELELKDGRTFDRYSAPMRDAEGLYYGRVWYFRDVTERKLAEAALRAERDRAQQYLDDAEVTLLALDPEMRVTMINRKGCALLGWTEAELLGKNWVETCLPPEDVASASERYRKLPEGNTQIIRRKVLTKSGKERLIEWHTRIIKDAHGRFTGTFSSGADITEEQAALEALRVAEERMRFALQSAGVGVWDMDYTTGALRWSEVLEGQHGLKPGAFPGTLDAFFELVHPDDVAGVQETLGKALKSGSDFFVQHRAVWPDGTIRWLTGTGRVVLGPTGEPMRGIGIKLDVTERRLLEDQLRQSQKMEALGVLAGGVAHDFNNILSVILSYSEVLGEELTVDDPHRGFVEQIKLAGMRAAGLTRQLLAFSRQQVIEPRIVDLNEVLEGLDKLLGRLLREDIELKTMPEASLGRCKCDPGQLEQVIMNLVVNARDAMPEGGKLIIETANVELDDEYAEKHIGAKPGLYVMLAVSDTGIGMDKATQARIFEPFFTTKEKGKGTGLGLSTVFGIVEQFGGRVWVYSELGKGTTFKVYLPRTDEVEMAIARSVESGVPGSETILLVEDENAIREVARQVLARKGYRVLEASNGATALAVSEQQEGRIHLLVTDVIMPGMSGKQLAETLRVLRPAMKVLFMSGYTDGALVGELAAGTAFLQKPLTPAALTRKVREVLDGA